MIVYEANNSERVSEIAAGVFAAQILEKPNAVLGFATGSTPLGLYEKLVEKHRDGILDFSSITTFNLDEYCGLDGAHAQSYRRFMLDNLFSHLNLKAENIHLPNGMAEDLERECTKYEERIEQAGGIDLQVLGIGHNGHIGFNEPQDIFPNSTHVEALKESTREANKRFFDDISEVPRSAISMGVGTIMRTRKIILLGMDGKQEIIRRMLEGPIDPQCPASILRFHPNVIVAYVK